MFDALACRREVSRRASPGAAAFVAIDVAFGKGGQLAVGGLLLLQILFEQAGAIRAPQELGPRDQSAVTRHLVVLDGLSRGDRGRVEDVLVVDFAGDVVRLFDDAADCGAVDP
jgi:hypothetical protein